MNRQLVRRVVVTGPESTGKTTLARELAAHYGVLWVAEQARTYAERVNRPLTADDVGPIASAQITAEDTAMISALRRGDSLLLLDTDLLSTVLYARHYYGVCPAWIEAEARARLANQYLLAETDLPWTADGIRDRPAARELLRELFRRTLAEFGANVCPVSGTGSARLTAGTACIESVEKE